MDSKQIVLQKQKYREGGIRERVKKRKKEEKPESTIALIGVLASAFVGAYIWLLLLCG